MGGTQRIAKFCKYLPDFGWTPIVITVKDVAYYAHDTTLMNDVQHTEIVRTHSLDPLRILALRKKNHQEKNTGPDKHFQAAWRGNKGLNTFNRILNWLLIPDSKVLWLPFVIFQALKIIRHQNIEIVFTTSPPHSLHLAGVFLKLIAGTKWVGDFRDEWTGGESQPCPTTFHLWLNRIIEKFTLKRMDAMLGICQHLVDNLYKKSGNSSALYKTMPNGFDADDFEAVQHEPPLPKFTVVHCGSISKVSDPEPFLMALESLFHEQPNLRDRIAVRFVGIDVFGRLNPLLEKYGLADVVEAKPYLPHQQAIRLMMQAHVLLLLVIRKTKEEIITSKVYEYLATGRRILAIIPSGELADILTAADAGKIILNHHRIDQIKGAISAFYAEYIKGTLNIQPTQFINQFERKRLTEDLATIFNRLTENRRNV